jgi:hypothetical protein
VAKTVTTLIQVSMSGDGFAAAPLFSQSSQNLAGSPPTSVALINGNTTVNVPAAAQGFTIVPPPGSTVAKTLKGIAGDTGVPIHNTLPTSVALTPGALASFVIGANGAETVEVIWQ